MRAMKSLIRGDRRRHGVPTLNVASMPDLIFTVLFFFMIVTHMRSDEVKVRLEVPAGSEVKKLTGHPAVINIYIGRQGDRETRSQESGVRRQDNTWLVQLNGDLVSPSEIPAMGLVSDVKQALQQAYALKINYSATEISP